MNAPDTQVRIDGHYVGTAHPQTPLQLDTGLPVGTVTLSASASASASGYKSTERKIQLRNRKWVEASFSLTRKGPDPQEVLREQLATYRAHMETEHYTTGDGGTALPCYRAVLALDPDNQEAKDGLAQMARYYQKQAQAALAADALAKAEEKLEGLRQVDPDSPVAAELAAKIAALRADSSYQLKQRHRRRLHRGRRCRRCRAGGCGWRYAPCRSERCRGGGRRGWNGLDRGRAAR